MRIQNLVPKYKSWPIYRAGFWRNLYKKLIFGFDEGDLFSLDYHLTKLIYPRIRAFREEYEAHPFNVPDDYLYYEQQRMIKKGAKWNSQWARLDDKKLEEEAWDRAIAKWIDVLKQIEAGFEDYLLEENDWCKWVKKWQPEVEYIQKKIDAAKTLKKKEEIWNSMHTWRKYNPSIQVAADDVSYSCREEAKRLLYENYNKLWR